MAKIKKLKPGEQLSKAKIKTLKDKKELICRHYGDTVYREALRGRLPPPAIKELLEREDG